MTDPHEHSSSHCQHWSPRRRCCCHWHQSHRSCWLHPSSRRSGSSPLVSLHSTTEILAEYHLLRLSDLVGSAGTVGPDLWCWRLQSLSCHCSPHPRNWQSALKSLSCRHRLYCLEDHQRHKRFGPCSSHLWWRSGYWVRRWIRLNHRMVWSLQYYSEPPSRRQIRSPSWRCHQCHPFWKETNRRCQPANHHEIHLSHWHKFGQWCRAAPLRSQPSPLVYPGLEIQSLPLWFLPTAPLH